MKQIFLESHNIKNPYFGFGQFNYHLIKAIYDLNDSELQFTINAKNTHALEKEFGTYFNYNTYNSLTRYPLFRITKRFDLWHSMNQNIKIEPRYKTPYLMTVHDVHFIDEQKDDKKILNRFQKKINRCNSIVYISEFAKKNTHEYFNIPNIPEYVIYNGNPILDTKIPETFKPDFTTNKKFLFSIGEFTARKNFGALVKMLKHLPEFELVLAGNTNKPYFESLTKLISDLGLQKRVHIVGKISDLAKKYYLKNCSAFVFPSLREGFGIPPVEAMTFGKPVFMSNNTSLPEIGGEFGFYWDNYEPEYMAKILLDGLATYNADKSLKENIKLHASTFNWANTAKHYIDVYKTILETL